MAIRIHTVNFIFITLQKQQTQFEQELSKFNGLISEGHALNVKSFITEKVRNLYDSKLDTPIRFPSNYLHASTPTHFPMNNGEDWLPKMTRTYGQRRENLFAFTSFQADSNLTLSGDDEVNCVQN